MQKKFQIVLLCFALYIPAGFLQAQAPATVVSEPTPQAQQVGLKAVEASLTGGIAGIKAGPGTESLIGAGTGLLVGAGGSSGAANTDQAAANGRAAREQEIGLAQVGQ